MRQITSIVIHHSVTPRDLPLAQSVASFDANHKERLHPTANSLGYHIAYHYVIAGNGDMQATRGLDEVGYHASSSEVNNVSVGICLTGNFDVEIPSTQQMQRLHTLVFQLRQQFGIDPKNVVGHRKYAAKSCPGKNFTDTLIHTAATIVLHTPNPDEPSAFAQDAWNRALAKGIVSGNPKGELSNRDAEIILGRLGVLSQLQGKLTRERFIVALDRLKGI